MVPFREQGGHKRTDELATILNDLLTRSNGTAVAQGSELYIFVAEQSAQGSFNRGALLNVAFDRARHHFAGQPFTAVTQDCDLIPEDDMFKWYFVKGDGPLHLTSYIYCPSLGGVAVYSNDQYLTMNGYTNEMWGWGGEDDDAMDRWMAGPSREVIVPAGGERFKNLGGSFDNNRDKKHYDQSMQVWKVDNAEQEWVENGFSNLKYDLLETLPKTNARIEHVKVDLSKLKADLAKFLYR